MTRFTNVGYSNPFNSARKLGRPTILIHTVQRVIIIIILLLSLFFSSFASFIHFCMNFFPISSSFTTRIDSYDNFFGFLTNIKTIFFLSIYPSRPSCECVHCHCAARTVLYNPTINHNRLRTI